MRSFPGLVSIRIANRSYRFFPHGQTMSVACRPMFVLANRTHLPRARKLLVDTPIKTMSTSLERRYDRGCQQREASILLDVVPEHSRMSSSLNPVPSFEDTSTSFATKSTAELVRSALSFALCQVPFLVNNSEGLLKLSRQILGDRLTDVALKGTLYGHFCAGEDLPRIKPTIDSLQRAGVGSILDFVAEADGEADQEGSPGKSQEEALAEWVLQENQPISRVYPFINEDACDEHVDTFLSCIRDVASSHNEGGFAAIKVTALCDPTLLARLSRAVVETQNLFAKFDNDQNGLVGAREFEEGLRAYFRDEDAQKLSDLFSEYTERTVDGGTDQIDYVTWSLMMQPKHLKYITASCREAGPLSLAALEADEIAMLDRLYARVYKVAEEASKLGVRLLVDAEQTLYQPAIDNIVLDMQKQFNCNSTTNHPVVFNTYQCYLKDSATRLEQDLTRADRLGYHFGAKMVRGAYMESERAMADRFGYESPIHDTPEETHESYNSSIRRVLQYSKTSDPSVEVMLASHNQESIQLAVQAMNELDVHREKPTIVFAQLYGMMDHVTLALGSHGYRAYKYVPYGEVKLAMPYLIRRARENSSVSKSAANELSLIAHELKQRMLGSLWIR